MKIRRLYWIGQNSSLSSRTSSSWIGGSLGSSNRKDGLAKSGVIFSIIKDYLSIEHPYCSLWVQIRIKYEIALSRVHFLTQIALCSVQFANIYKVVAIKYLEKQI